MCWIHGFLFTFVICLTTAFNTRFIMDEPKNAEELQSPIEDNLTIEEEVIPRTNVYSMIGNYFAGNLKKVQETDETNNMIEKLNATLKEINKTTQVIRLTAEYVNISSHYVMSSISQYMNSISDSKELVDNVKDINNKLMSTLINHINYTVADLETKLKDTKVVSGEDLLFSISYHLVNAFQDMTNMVLNITSKKNNSQTSEPIVEINDKETQTETKHTQTETEHAQTETEHAQIETEHTQTETEHAQIETEAPIDPKILDTVEVFSSVEVKSLKNQEIPVFYLTSWTDCNSVIRPVCAVDLKIKKYIIFLNDCRRVVHNRMHGTNYTVYGMDVCTGLFLRNPGIGAQVTPSTVDQIP